MVQVPFFQQSSINLRENLIIDIVNDNAFGHRESLDVSHAPDHSYAMPALRSMRTANQTINKNSLKGKSDIKVKCRRPSPTVTRCRWNEDSRDEIYELLQSLMLTRSLSEQKPIKSYSDPPKVKLIDSTPRLPKRHYTTPNNEKFCLLDQDMSIHHTDSNKALSVAIGSS